ncbi:hypothetical protein WA026_015376 [Henosepilachna vigintioctopunctata]|uniref:LRR 8 domain containing protein n=1 Tax=Henosepilachna vigintioctopunctata TaxID=420089 RepID=A0AAW1UE57_9CUCU
MNLSFLILVTVFVQNVFCQTEILMRSGRIRYVTDSEVHKSEQIQNLEYFNNSVISNGTHLKIITTSMPILIEGSFRNMENLQVLQIPKCQITEIRPGAFLNLPNLDRIQLQDNEITRIENGIFNAMLISQLYMHRNQIEFIHSEAFDNMPNLHKIKLNGNRLKMWDSNWFYNTPKLTEVLIRRNIITTIEKNAFKNIKKLQVGHDEDGNSTSIYLSKNKISSIHPQAFSNLVRLNQLFLDRNNLSVIPDGLFAEIGSITFLILEGIK